MVSPKSLNGVRGYVQVLFEIGLLLESGELGLFTGTSMTDVLGRSNPYYYFPGTLPILAETRWSIFTRQVTSDTEAALTWFKSLDTPNKCLDLLASGNTAVGPIKERGAARDAWDFLSSLQDSNSSQS